MSSVNTLCSSESDLPDICSLDESLQSLDESTLDQSTLSNQTSDHSTKVSIVDDDSSIPATEYATSLMV